MSIEFEWDEHKSEVNRDKHGISFEEAKEIWEGIFLEVKEMAQQRTEEIRSATIGWIKEELYVAIWTMRGDRVRLISVRRARDYEKESFHNAIQNDRGNGSISGE